MNQKKKTYNYIQFLGLLLFIAFAACQPVEKGQEAAKPLEAPVSDCQEEFPELLGGRLLKSHLIRQASVKRIQIHAENRVKEDILFNKKGNKTVHVWRDTLEQESVREVYTYQEDGLPVLIERFHEGEPYAVTKLSYGESGALQGKETRTSKRQVDHQYSYENDCLSKVETSIYDLLSDSSLIYSAYYTYQYDSKGLCKAKEWYVATDQMHAKWRYTHDESGLLINVRMLNAQFQDQAIQEFIYANGQLLVENTNRGKFVYTYNSKDLPIEKKIISMDKTTHIETYRYEFW